MITKEELEEKFNSELTKLSARARNILADHGLLVFEYFFDQYFNNESRVNFKFCRNCGLKTTNELNQFISEICNERVVSIQILKPLNFRPQLLIKNPVAPLKADFKTKLHFESEYQSLSVRTKNILKSIDSNNIDGFYQNAYFNDNQFFLNIRNCGVDTVHEIQAFKSTFKEILDKIHKSSIDNNPFSDLNYYIYKSNFFKPIELEIFNNYYGFGSSDKVETLTDIAQRNRYSRERVRQISKSMLERINELVIRLTKGYNLSFEKYFIHNYFFVDNDFTNKINSLENTHLSSTFVALVLKYVNNPDYLFLEVGKNISCQRVLFVKECVPFDSARCYSYLAEKLFSKKSQNMRIQINELIQYFSRTDNIEEKEKIVITNLIVALIKLLDYKSEICIEGETIVIRKNSRKLHIDLFWEILDEYKKPMHFLDIYQECLARGHNIKSSTSVHSTLIRCNDIFGLKGPGIYGLLEWGGYFGTIGDVAAQILEERESPIPRHELEDILCRELYISKDSINVVLFGYDMENRFSRTKNDTVSLKEWEN